MTYAESLASDWKGLGTEKCLQYFLTPYFAEDFHGVPDILW